MQTQKELEKNIAYDIEKILIKNSITNYKNLSGGIVSIHSGWKI